MRVQDFQAVYQNLKPDGLFLEPGARVQWLCGPWPFGVDRKALARVFREQKWQARPMQPIRSVDGGVMWSVQSVAAPEKSVWMVKHGQVVITRHDSNQSLQADTAHVIGQQSTVQLCTSQAGVPATDPWLIKDPWKSSTASRAPVNPNPVGPDTLQDLQRRLEDSILAKIAERMEVDDQESRLQALEQQMQQVAAGHQTLERTVHEHHQQHTAQVQSLQGQMAAQFEVQRKDMQQSFADQMTQLEAILTKRGRFE